jgi:hypothetical protein
MLWKVKVTISLGLINQARCHKGIMGSGVIPPLFFNLVLEGNVQSASRLGQFTSEKRTRWYQLNRRLGGS